MKVTKSRSSPKATASWMLGKNLSLFSMYFGANSVPSLSRPTSLARSMIFRCPSCVEEAGIAGLDIAVRGHRLGGLLVVLEIGDEHAGRAEQHLAVLRDADIDVGRGRPDGVGVIAPSAARHVEEGLGLPVELLEVEPERAVEREELGPDRLARGVGDAHAREAERVLQRPVDQRRRRAR